MHQINFLNFLLILPLSPDSFHASFLFFLKSKVSLAEKRKEKWIIYRWEKKDGSISQSNHAILFEHDFRDSFGIGEFGSRRRGSNFSRKSVQVFAATTTKMDDWFNDIDADLWEEMARIDIEGKWFHGEERVVGKMTVEFSVPDVLPNEPWRIFTSDQLAKWKGRSRKCSRSAGPVPYFLIWRSVFAHSEQENSTTPYHHIRVWTYRVWKKAEIEARSDSLENCRLKI